VLDRKVGQVVQDQHLPLRHRQPEQRDAQRGGGQRITRIVQVMRAALACRQPHGQRRGPVHPPARVDSQPEGDPPDPRLGLVVPGDPRPAGQRAGERLLRDVLGLVPLADDGGHHRDHAAIAGRVELHEVIVFSGHVLNTPEPAAGTKPIR